MNSREFPELYQTLVGRMVWLEPILPLYGGKKEEPIKYQIVAAYLVPNTDPISSGYKVECVMAETKTGHIRTGDLNSGRWRLAVVDLEDFKNP